MKIKSLKLIIIAAILIIVFPIQSQDEGLGEYWYGGGSPPEGYNSSCEEHPELYQAFGPYCLHPVFWDIPRYIPRGYPLGFHDNNGYRDIGLIVGYEWIRESREYAYKVLITPEYNGAYPAYRNVLVSQVVPLPSLE